MAQRATSLGPKPSIFFGLLFVVCCFFFFVFLVFVFCFCFCSVSLEHLRVR